MKVNEAIKTLQKLPLNSHGNSYEYEISLCKKSIMGRRIVIKCEGDSWEEVFNEFQSKFFTWGKSEIESIELADSKILLFLR